MANSTSWNPLSFVSRFVPFEALTSPSTTKINRTFGLYLTAGAYCLYNVYQWIHWQSGASFLLDSPLKAIKCKRLLIEARVVLLKDEEGLAKSCLKECKTLLLTIGSQAPQKILLELVKLYAEVDLEEAIQLAQNLTSSADLYEAAETIQKKMPAEQDLNPVILLFHKSLVACDQIDKTSEKLQQLLKLAKVFHALKPIQTQHTATCIKHKNDALDIALKRLANKLEPGLAQMQAYCAIAKCYQELGCSKVEIDVMFLSIDSPLFALKGVDQFLSGYLADADASLSCGRYERASNALSSMHSLRYAKYTLDPLWATDLAAEIKLRIILQKHLKEKWTPLEIFKTYAFYETHSLKVKTSLKEELEMTLQFASALQELKQSKDTEAAPLSDQYANQACEQILLLPLTTDQEISDKAKWLKRVGAYEALSDPKKRATLKSLRELYHKSYLDNGHEFDKNKIGLLYLELDNKWHQDSLFFERFLEDLTKRNEDVSSKIERLITYSQNAFLTQLQKNDMLRAAEALLAKNPSHSHTLARLAEAYLEIDKNKTFELIRNFEKHQAAYFRNIAFVAAASLVAMRFSKLAGSLLLAGALVVPRLYHR